ncbi:hypothetical protein PUV47_04815 [Pseudovibrio exalbescens]|uniref:hypothetical protein n=1 Tax=Pseudovibrio exalbescens TaxID=197461 RepID=UPI0023651014|nr:hypothetical protein [Pseudovibrio exalbescens]MDD7909229.1 hypothetical protein [Pseudovibrio exalbescens]
MNRTRVSWPMALRWAALILLVSMTPGCTWWPDSGSGGAAERFTTDQRSIRSYEIILTDLERRGADRWAAVDMKRARAQLVKAKQAAAGGLAYDAEEDLALLWFQLQIIEKKLNRLEQAGHTAVRS